MAQRQRLLGREAGRRARRARRVAVGPWQVTLDDVEPVAGPNWTALEADDDRALWRRHAGDASHRRRAASGRRRSRPANRALLTRWNGQLYAVLGEEAEDGRWQLRLWWKPFVPLIWLGGLLIALGGAAGADRPRRERPAPHRRARQDRLPPRAAGPMSDEPVRKRAPRWALWLPLALFAGFVVLVLIGLLRPADREVASAMIGKPLPQFDAARRRSPSGPASPRADLAGGKPRLLNVFASWCMPCAAEAPQLEALARAGRRDRRRRDPRPPRGPRRASWRATAIPSPGSAPTTSARCSSRSAPRACPRPS